MILAGNTTWKLNTLTLYNAYPDDDSKVAKLEVYRSVNGGTPERALLKAAPDDLMGAGGVEMGVTINSDTYDVQGLVRGADDSIWVALVHVNIFEPLNELLFRKVEGDVITKEERFGIDLEACSTSTLQPECARPRSLGGAWASGSPVMFGSGQLAPSAISALLVQTGELR